MPEADDTQPAPDASAVTGAAEPECRVLIAVCTLNEAENIVPLVTQLRSAVPAADVMVVDDDSPDGTADRVAALADDDPHVRLTVRRGQRGLGSAIRMAMQSAVEQRYTYFINLDADFSHDPRQVPRLLQRAAESPDVDVVIGSRYVTGGSIVGWPLHRRIMSGLVNRFATLCLRLPVRDCSGSMRCYRVSALANLGLANVQIDGYAVLEELLVRLRRGGSKFAEVPITFTERRHGTSKLTLREAVRSMTQMIALAFR